MGSLERFEAYLLSLWYLELVLLWLFDYRGKYSNRLGWKGWNAESVECVPWASGSFLRRVDNHP